MSRTMAKTVDPQSSVVVIQTIFTQWEKSARGGANAVLRNQVPDALNLPSSDVVPAPLFYVLHLVSYSNRNNFAEPIRNTVQTSMVEPNHLRGITTSLASEILTVSYQYSTSQGAPERHAQKIEALNLSFGQWGRIEYNGRHSDMDNGHWWYEKRVYNIGLFAAPSASAFTRSEPTKIFSQIAHLF